MRVRKPCILKSHYGKAMQAVYWYERVEDKSKEDSEFAEELFVDLFRSPTINSSGVRYPLSAIETISQHMILLTGGQAYLRTSKSAIS